MRPLPFDFILMRLSSPQHVRMQVSKDFEKYMADHAKKYKHYLEACAAPVQFVRNEARGADAAGDFQKYFEDSFWLKFSVTVLNKVGQDCWLNAVELRMPVMIYIV